MNFPEKVLLLDLETTGLSRENDAIISIGMAYLNPDQECCYTYFFLESLEEEAKLLQHFLDWITDYHTIYTYYGKGFEYPFLLNRMAYHHLDPTPLLKLKLIDMRPTLKHFAKNRSELETLWHYHRHSQSSGHDIVKLYQTYLNCRGEIYKQCILEHQKEELGSLERFFELYRLLYDTDRWTLQSSTVSHHTLILQIQLKMPLQYSFKGTAFDLSIEYKTTQNNMTLTLPILSGCFHHALSPLKDYFYIPSQKQLIHKSLASFIHASDKRKATKEECQVQKESTFLKLGTSYKVNVPLWHHEDCAYAIELSDFSLEILQDQIFYLFFQNKS